MKPHLRRCKVLVLEGLRGAKLGRALGVSGRTANNYIQQLIFMGELVEIKGPKNSTPRIFADGKAQPSPFKNIDDMSQSTENTDDPEFFKRVVGGSGDQENLGRPEKLVNFHCSGAFDIPVLVLGDHAGVIRDKDGWTIGEWSDIKDANGSLRQYGHARLYPNESLNFTLYLAKGGNKLTTVPQPRDIYYKTAETDGPRAMVEQVYRLLNLFNDLYGWKFGAPVFKGAYHIANRSPDMAPLLSLYDKEQQRDGARVFVDYSHGTPEIETATDSPNAYRDQITLMELPERIDSITASLTAVHGTLRILADNMDQLTAITAQIINNQAQQAQAMTSQQYTPAPSDNRGYF